MQKFTLNSMSKMTRLALEEFPVAVFAVALPTHTLTKVLMQ